MLAEHTYAHRAAQVERLFRNGAGRKRQSAGGVMRIVVLGLSLTSSWGNGHATTYRALLRGLVRRGHDMLFLERDQPWYASHRDLPHPPTARTRAVRSVGELERDSLRDIARCRSW